MAHGDEEVGLILSSRIERVSRSQKVTVRRECGSRRCSHLSDLGSPDIGRGKKKEAKWLAGTPNGSGVPFPSGVVRKFLSKSRGRRTIAILLRAKDKRLTETRRTPKSFKPVLKTVQSLLARERRKILQWNPVKKKNKISNFGTFFLYIQILFTTLSLSIWKRMKAKKRHLYSWTILLYVFDTLNVYIYITVVKNLCIFILPCGLCYYFMLSFQLLFALHYLA